MRQIKLKLGPYINEERETEGWMEEIDPQPVSIQPLLFAPHRQTERPII